MDTNCIVCHGSGIEEIYGGHGTVREEPCSKCNVHAVWNSDFVRKCDERFPDMDLETRKTILEQAREVVASEWAATYPDYFEEDGNFYERVRLGLHDDMTMVMVAFRAIAETMGRPF